MTNRANKLTIHNISPILLLFIMAISCQQHVKYDLVLSNGQVYNVETGTFQKSNVAVKDGKIARITKEPLEGKVQLSAEGRFIYPGFIDAHAHFVQYANGLSQVNLVGTQSFEEVIGRVTKFVQEHPEIDFILGRGWDQNDWQVKEFPTNDTLNVLFPQFPVVLERIDGHAALANQAALDLIGELPNSVQGGAIVMNNGKPTGLLIDMAIDLIPQPEVPAKKLVERLALAQQNCFERGITGVVDAGLGRASILLLDSLQRAGALKMPIYAMIRNDANDYEPFFKQGRLKTDLMHVNSIKVYGDGALGSRGALLLEPYSDDLDNQGLMLTSETDLFNVCKKAYENGFQVNVHAIGDSANRLVAETFAQVLKQDNDKRWRVEHAQVVNPADSSLWMDYNILPSVQPTHATSDMYWAEERLGHDRINHAYAFKSLLRWSDKITLGTDFPVEDIDPRKTLFAAVMRQDVSGFPQNGFLPHERLTRKEAILGMTLWAAFAQFEEKEKGSIDVGKWADFVVTGTNLMTCTPEEILSMPIDQCVVHGELVFDNEQKTY